MVTLLAFLGMQQCNEDSWRSTWFLGKEREISEFLKAKL